MHPRFKFVIFVVIVSEITSINTEEILTKDLKFKLNNGNFIPAVGLGTALIGYESKDGVIKKALDYALSAGYRLIDTAKVYRNEEEIGEALKELLPKHNLTRQDIWITTKLSEQDLGDKAYEALKESLQKLQTDYVDLYLIHWPGNYGPKATNFKIDRLRDIRNETWKQLTKGLKDGLAKNIGVSNYLIRHLGELKSYNNGIKPAINQVEWHPLYHPQDLLDYCDQEGITIQAYSSLGAGAEHLINNPTVAEIARKLDKSTAQVLLKWALQQDMPIIPKATSRGHIYENIDLDFNINDNDMRTLASLGGNNSSIGKIRADPDLIP